jgi:hypothetical protein
MTLMAIRMDIGCPKSISVPSSAFAEGAATMYGHPDYFDSHGNPAAHRFLKVFLLAIAAIAMFALFR